MTGRLRAAGFRSFALRAREEDGGGRGWHTRNLQSHGTRHFTRNNMAHGIHRSSSLSHHAQGKGTRLFSCAEWPSKGMYSFGKVQSSRRFLVHISEKPSRKRVNWYVVPDNKHCNRACENTFFSVGFPDVSFATLRKHWLPTLNWCQAPLLRKKPVTSWKWHH